MRNVKGKWRADGVGECVGVRGARRSFFSHAGQDRPSRMMGFSTSEFTVAISTLARLTLSSSERGLPTAERLLV